MSKVTDKVFDCPKCNNKTLYPVDGNDKSGGIGWHTLCICAECGAELYSETQYDISVKFVELDADIE